MHNQLDYNEIIDGIFIGTNQCCQTHFDAELLQAGIRADISLEEGRLDAPFGVEMYVWMPVVDHTAPSTSQMQFGIAALERLVALGKKVYVHCKNGHGRAPTLVAGYLVKKGMSPDEAEAFVKNKRPSIHLEDSQREALRALVANDGELFACPACGFHYRDKEEADACEAWCREHKTCSSTITAHAVEKQSAL